MPQFFFNYTADSATMVDDIGTEFPSLEAAYLSTCEAALAIAFEKLQARRDPANDEFEILDDKRNLLMQVPFSEVLRPAALTTLANKRQNAAFIENCRHQMARNHRLKNDIRAEFAQTRRIFADIRAALSNDRFS